MAAVGPPGLDGMADVALGSSRHSRYAGVSGFPRERSVRSHSGGSRRWKCLQRRCCGSKAAAAGSPLRSRSFTSFGRYEEIFQQRPQLGRVLITPSADIAETEQALIEYLFDHLVSAQ
jgi:hypothetical protein